MKVLVTAGATREPVDAVRFFSNVSTGATGAALAEAFAARGHGVTLLRGEGAAVPDATVNDREVFSSADDLGARLRARLATGGYDLVLMAAAVADYRPETAEAGKIFSDLATLTVRLVRNPKLLPQLKAFSPRPLRVVGFKLTAGAEAAAREAAVAAQLAAGGVDATVHNDLGEIRAAPRHAHPFRLYLPGAAGPRPLAGVDALATALASLFPCAR